MSEGRLLKQPKATIAGEENAEMVVGIAKRVVEEGIDIKAAIDAASQAIRLVGDKYETGEIFSPELMLAGKKMKRCMAILEPHLKVGEKSEASGPIAIGTVSGDIHDIGKNLVATMLTMGGFEVFDLGVDIAPFDFMSAAEEKGADIIALSSLMTTSLPYQQEVIDPLKEMALRGKYYVIIGGGPVTAEFASKTGADGWTGNAATVIRLCEKLMTSGETPPVANTFVA